MVDLMPGLTQALLDKGRGRLVVLYEQDLHAGLLIAFSDTGQGAEYIDWPTQRSQVAKPYKIVFWLKGAGNAVLPLRVCLKALENKSAARQRQCRFPQ
jgi:hypothetical protein